MGIEEVEALLQEVRDRGVSLWVAQGKLQFRAANGALTESLRHRLRENKDLIIRALGAPVFRRGDPRDSVPILECSRGFWNLVKSGAFDVDMINGTRFTIRIDGPFDVAALRASIDSLATRHTILTARIVEDEQGARFVMDCSRDTLLNIEDLCPDGGSVSEEHVDQAVSRQVWRHFDTANGPLFRAFVIHVSSADHVVGFVLHHFVGDLFSIRILVQDLLAGYAAFNEPAPVSRDAPPLQYADYILAMNEWFREGAVQLRLPYWKWKLQNAPPTRLPPDFEAEPDCIGDIDYIPFAVDTSVERALRELADKKGVTLFIILVAAYVGALACLARLSDIVVSLLYSGRYDPSLNGMVGATVDLIMLRTCVDCSMSFEKLLEQVQETWVDAYRHYVPFHFVASIMAETGASQITPLFNFLGESPAASDARDPFAGRFRHVEVTPLSAPRSSVAVLPAQRVQLDLSRSGISGAMVYSRALYKDDTISRMARLFCRSLSLIGQDASQTLECLNEEQLGMHAISVAG